MTDEFVGQVNRQLKQWESTIEEIEERAQSVGTFDKLELLARAERLRTRSREIERQLDLLEEVEDESEADTIRGEIERVQKDVRDMLSEAEEDARKRTDGD